MQLLALLLTSTLTLNHTLNLKSTILIKLKMVRLTHFSLPFLYFDELRLEPHKQKQTTTSNWKHTLLPHTHKIYNHRRQPVQTTYHRRHWIKIFVAITDSHAKAGTHKGNMNDPPHPLTRDGWHSQSRDSRQTTVPLAQVSVAITDSSGPKEMEWLF